MKSVFSFKVGKVTIPSALLGNADVPDVKVEGLEFHIEAEMSPEDRTSIMEYIKELPAVIPGLQAAIQEALGASYSVTKEEKDSDEVNFALSVHHGEVTPATQALLSDCLSPIDVLTLTSGASIQLSRFKARHLANLLKGVGLISFIDWELYKA